MYRRCIHVGEAVRNVPKYICANESSVLMFMLLDQLKKVKGKGK